jgi:hypothetical protein
MMVYRPLSQQPVWETLHTLGQHKMFHEYAATEENATRLTGVITTTQDLVAMNGGIMLSSLRTAVEKCLQLFAPSNKNVLKTPELPAAASGCRQEEPVAQSAFASAGLTLRLRQF